MPVMSVELGGWHPHMDEKIGQVDAQGKIG